MPISGIAFDLEGTIVDLEKFHFDGFIMAAEEGGLTLTFEQIVADIPLAIGGGDQLIAEGIAKLSGGRLTPEWIKERKMEHYRRCVRESKIAPRPGFLKVFRKIRALALPVAIGSLTPREQAKELIGRSGIVELFSLGDMVFLEDVQNKKPAPDVYLETARRLGISPQEQLVFEDSVPGVMAARAAGSLVVAMPTHHAVEQYVALKQSHASRIFDDWREMNIGHVIRNLSQE